MHTVEELTAEVLKLPAEQRFSLVHKLLLSIESGPSTQSDEAWDSEIRHRIERYRAGQVRTIPGAQVLAELDKKLGR